MFDSFDEDCMGVEAKVHQTCQQVAVNIRIHDRGLEERLELPKDLNYKRAEEGEKYVSFRVINQQFHELLILRVASNEAQRRSSLRPREASLDNLDALDRENDALRLQNVMETHLNWDSS